MRAASSTDAPNHVVWQARPADKSVQANVTVCPASDHSSSSSLHSSLSQPTAQDAGPCPGGQPLYGNGSTGYDGHAPGAGNHHQVWESNAGSSNSNSNSSKGTVGNPRTYAWQENHGDALPEVVGPPPSIGSQGHPDGCQPCGFLSTKKGCRFGIQCNHCHYEHPKRNQNKPCKWRRERAKKYAELASRADGGCSDDGEECEGPVEGMHPQAVTESFRDVRGPHKEDELPVFGVQASSSSRRKHIVSL